MADSDGIPIWERSFCMMKFNNYYDDHRLMLHDYYKDIIGFKGEVYYNGCVDRELIKEDGDKFEAKYFIYDCQFKHEDGTIVPYKLLEFLIKGTIVKNYYDMNDKNVWCEELHVDYIEVISSQ